MEIALGYNPKWKKQHMQTMESNKDADHANLRTDRRLAYCMLFSGHILYREERNKCNCLVER